MCIIIDANTLSLFFNSDIPEHREFKPVFDWIHKGKGMIVYGGTKYIKELEKANKLKLIKLYNDRRKVVHVCDEKVDAKQDKIERKFNDRSFNDSHLVAIVNVSKCKLICSRDKEACPFLTNPDLYQKGVQRPKIYGGRRNENLLTDSNIADCCKPFSRMTKEQRESLQYK